MHSKMHYDIRRVSLDNKDTSNFLIKYLHSQWSKYIIILWVNIFISSVYNTSTVVSEAIQDKLYCINHVLLIVNKIEHIDDRF